MRIYPYLPAASVGSTLSNAAIVVEADVVLSASCATLSSTSNVTMFYNMMTVAMVSSASGRIPAAYIAVIKAGVDYDSNTCVEKPQQQPSSGSRRRSLFQTSTPLSYGVSSLTSSQKQQQESTGVDSIGESDGTATVEIAVTWPADVVASTGLTSAQAALMVANCTSPRALSTIFTLSFMAAYSIRFTPFATVKVLSETDPSPQLLETSSNEANSAATTMRSMIIFVYIDRQ